MKTPISDIKVSDRRSVRRIPLPENRRRGETSGNDEPLLYEEDRPETVEIIDGGWSKTALWLSVCASVAVLLIVFSWAFTGATVIVTPRSVAITLADNFGAESAATAAGALSFVTVPFQKIGEEVIPALEQKRVSLRATGTIVVYNNFSTAPQRLIKNTRFESPQGRIYRIDRSIVVPGQKKEGGRLIPGSVEAVVFADSPGEAFNSPLTDFTVPGFKNDSSRYAAFYARSKTALSGGFEGVVRIPEEAAEKTARENIRTRITEELLAQAKRAVLKDAVFFDGAYRITAESLPTLERGNSEAVVREKIALAAFFLPRAELTEAIARKKLPRFDDQPASLPALDSLAFQFVSDSPDENRISFSLSGQARFISLFDGAGLAEALRGKQKSEVARVLSAFPAIEKADVILRPFWRRSFPDKAGKIKIETVTEPSSP